MATTSEIKCPKQYQSAVCIRTRRAKHHLMHQYLDTASQAWDGLSSMGQWSTARSDLNSLGESSMEQEEIHHFEAVSMAYHSVTLLSPRLGLVSRRLSQGTGPTFGRAQVGKAPICGALHARHELHEKEGI